MGWGKFSKFINFEVGSGTGVHLVVVLVFILGMIGIVGVRFLKILSQIYIETLKIRRLLWQIICCVGMQFTFIGMALLLKFSNIGRWMSKQIS
jgi:hypothetical protein